jgi:hypothetical protein
MNKPAELITLKNSALGFVVYGIGGGASRYQYRERTLAKFLEQLMVKMFELKDELNSHWHLLNLAAPGSKENVSHIDKFLLAAAWAYALVRELQPLAHVCVDGPTDPLKTLYIHRLEELYIKSYAIVHMFGDERQSMTALQGLLIDFEINGGIDLDGSPGHGFVQSITDYWIGYFFQECRGPIVYQRYGELMSALTDMVSTHYPKCLEPLAMEIRDLLDPDKPGFASQSITSPAKSELIGLLSQTESVLRERAKKNKKAA